MYFVRNKSYIVGIVLGMISIVALISGGVLFETNSAGYLQVKQAAITGSLTCQMQPGMYGQFFGDIHTYKEAESFNFTDADQDGHTDAALVTQFNDGTKSSITGSLRVVLPSSCEQLIHLHRKFHSMENVMTKLVLPAVRNALFFSGPHMSASESYAERRAEFSMLAEDQLKNGIIITDNSESQVVDQITGETKTVKVVNKKSCEKDNNTARCIGGFLRDESAFHEFGISVTNFVIDGIEYPQSTLDQIETQRKARMNILTQQAQAKEAEARASKADAEAKAQIAETRAKEEVAKTELVVRAEATKAQAVLVAQQQKEVAALDVQSADLEKKAKILRAEGDAEAASKLIQADGALDKKLNALVEINKVWADAYTSQRPTPDVVLGTGQSSNVNPASNFMEILSAKAARDLHLELGVKR
jgi:regulator of protease activity HflC (stomatin/prohibitin superfamily)